MQNKTTTNRKIIILGAGIGGLYVAGELGKKGYSVVVYERKLRHELGYPWADSVSKDTFKNVDITLPEDSYISKQVLNFYSPSGYGYIKQAQRASKNLDVDRKKLIEYLISLSEEHCDIRFGIIPDRLIVENDKVVGVSVYGKEEYCDLVIDSSGLFSPYRLQVPNKFLMSDELLPHDYLVAYRGY
ncbi:MAG: NAD(P)-binding protein, partial [Clostridia bacterium]|nr:NAD(P)-binding protein [Clostridia bacterium]